MSMTKLQVGITSALAIAGTSGFVLQAQSNAALRSEVKGKGVDVTIVVLGTVESPYWEHNPGSREHLPPADPRFVPTLSPDEAAEAIFAGVAQRRRTVVKPAIFRALFLLNALAPGLVARQLRRASRQR